MNRLAFASSLFLSLALGASSDAAEKKKPVKTTTTKAETVASAKVSGWLDWRGPFQTGVSLEKGLPDKIDAKQALWTADFPGQSAPVIANGKLSTGAVSVPERLARTAPNDFASYCPQGIRMPKCDARPSRDAFSHSKSEGSRPPRQAQYAAASGHDTPVTG